MLPAMVPGPIMPERIRGVGALSVRVAAGLAVAPLVASAQTSGPLQAEVPAEAWVALFDGQSLDGWIPKIRGYPTGENFGATFRVEDGLLTVSYDNYTSFDARFGHLFHVVPYSHYRLRIEYRFVGEQAPEGPDWARRNSGAMLHSQPPETMGLNQDFPISIEVQFLGGLSDGNRRSTANLCTPGTNVVYDGEFTSAHCINSRSATFDGEQWVLAEILVLGDERIEHFVNGESVIEYTQPTLGGGSVSGHDPAQLRDGEPLGRGYITVQSESHPVQFRRIELLNLAGCMDPEADAYRPWFVAADPPACD